MPTETREPEFAPAAGATLAAGRSNGLPRQDAVRVMQITARMNIGGPAYQVSLLGGRIDPERFSTVLVHGDVGPGEASFAGLAAEEGCRVRPLQGLGPEISPGDDARALAGLVTLMRRFQPQIVHTHTAKAGTLGRLAAWHALRPRPVIVHTYHGHVLRNYFGPFLTAAYRVIERRLARITDRLVAVSQGTVDDLVELRIADPSAFSVVPLGLDLERFSTLSREQGTSFRNRVQVGPDHVLLTCVSRLVPIKRIEVLLQAVALLGAQHPELRLAIVGDGQCRTSLERLAAELGLGDRVTFTGYMTDVTTVAAATDIAVLSSDDEGTPVSLIEAGAAAVPAVATAVGGNGEVVAADAGILVPPREPEAFAAALHRLASDRALRERMGRRARDHVCKRFQADRLLRDTEAMYEELLRDRRQAD
jgi:glycosyltransferase involved in cell wall biosynthesis